MLVDINGRKEPNKMGEDIFHIGFASNGYIVLKDHDDSAWWANCNLKGQGWLCTEWVLQNENMDYLH